MSLGGKCEPWDSALMPKRKKRFVYTIDRVNIVALISHTRLKKEKFLCARIFSFDGKFDKMISIQIY